MKKNILIVDDSQSLRRVIQRYLQGIQGVRFFEADDGGAAELVIQECHACGSPIDLVLLDWMMPKTTGLEFLERIRNVEAFAKTPKIIMLTAETYPDQIVACLKYDISSYMTKPFTQEALEAAVLKVLARGDSEDAV
ncbi:MAG TPA: two-component system response regulator [Bdellovibrionales bacterium]|nr:MAG: hypothetical protein A2Z97_05495 [Bdellovibrionales bacterium GWB1_52_6]OFZ05722.1 MAG: hypothetical protein A2X97_03400 [Bdellovibrionales bacterium GWA1_52_35]OFZ37934.1 MAG: hypothetical protein A2070_12905 [Bdellovibrionales bacterium GWC1_52_8]HAR44364.1 two-component system response regulator [Bdellovibrionales bacterium]HCM40338.1 two-component system response regulator [Bdellovibrionales bacterium]